ncbi:MAG: hypothetical protein Q7R85_02655 [bacterium]|nr:hypothetical protein [bacterium]
MIERLNLIKGPEGEGAGKPDIMEMMDVNAAGILVRRLLRYTLREYNERAMRESLSKRFVRHTKHLVAMQAAHIERVLWNGNALTRRLLIGIPPKERTENEEETLMNRIREVEFALLMHECAKMNPKCRGGVNPDRHMEETCNDTLTFLADYRRKRKPLADRIAAMVEVSGSPYSIYAKHTGTRTPATVEEAIVFAAVNLDAIDFWGARDIVWIRQHPEMLGGESLEPEHVRESLEFAKRMCDDAAKRVNSLNLRKLDGAEKKSIADFGIAYWRRSEQFFAFVEEWSPQSFVEFRGACTAFLRAEFGKRITRPEWNVGSRMPNIHD